MTDQEIEYFTNLIKNNDVYFVAHGHFLRCVTVILEWREKFPDGQYADITEPAVFFEDGTCAALWSSELSDFVIMNRIVMP